MKHRQKEPDVPTATVFPNIVSLTTPLDGATLPEYTGKSGKCVMCNSDKPRTQYFARGQTCTHVGPSAIGGVRNLYGRERLHRICKNCGYAWDEACYEQKDDSDDG